MENIYDIRKNKKLMYVLQKEQTIFSPPDELLSSVAIVVNMYYEDVTEYYFGYLDKIPQQISIYIISSKEIILDKARGYFQNRRNIYFLEKENRGRDISALLVAFREFAFRYTYVCFVHDKKARYRHLGKDTEIWIENLWGNTIASEDYVCNIIDIFERKQEIGLLVPPEPVGEYFVAWYKDAWGDNYELTCDLAEKLELKCDIRRDKSPITIGTVFWARICALKKLLEREWNYGDFPEEPLLKDGAINHAVERIIGYVAQDAGYQTGTVMTNAYAGSMLLFLQDSMKEMASHLESKMHMHNIHQMQMLETQKEQIVQFFFKYEDVFLYGAGVYGKGLLTIIREYGLEPAGFVVTDGKKVCEQIDGLKVYEFHEIKSSRATGIIIAVGYKLQEEIEDMLKTYGWTNYILGYP